MNDLTAAIIVPALRALNLNYATAAMRDTVFVPLPPPMIGTPPFTIAFVPNEKANEVVVEAALLAVPPARVAPLSVYLTTVCAMYKGLTWMIDEGVAYACIFVDLTYTGDGAAAVGVAFERLMQALSNTYGEIIRIGVGAPRRRSRAEQELSALVAPFDAPQDAGTPGDDQETVS